MNEKMTENRLKCTFINIVPQRESALILSGLIATFGLHIISMDMFLSKCKLIRKKDGGVYVAPPSEKYKDPQTGKDVYSNFFWFGEKTSEFFQKEALKAITTYCISKGIADPAIMQPRADGDVSSPIEVPYRGLPETQSTFKVAGDPFSY